MTAADKANAERQVADREPTELEALLPWHAAGTLNARDARRVNDALAKDPELARQYAVIQDEYAETILLNESLGAPSTRAMQKLFVAIDAEPARKSSAWSNPLGRMAAFFANLAPRTLAWSAVAGALAILLQAAVIGTVLVKDRAGADFQTASYNGSVSGGAAALVRFAPEASAADITKFLESYKASIVAGPNGGMFRIRFGDKALSRNDSEQLLTRLRGEKVVGFVVGAD